MAILDLVIPIERTFSVDINKCIANCLALLVCSSHLLDAVSQKLCKSTIPCLFHIVKNIGTAYLRSCRWNV